MDSNITIFVISLKKSINRRESLKALFQEKNIAFEWMDAVYGKDLSESEMKQYCDLEAIEKNPTWLNRSAIGCALSHYNAYQEILKRKLPYAVIFEDDVIPEKNFLLELQSIIPHLKKSEIIALFYQSWVPLQLEKNSAEGTDRKHTLYHLADYRQLVSSAAYLISYEACKLLTEKMLPIRLTADSWGEYQKVDAIKSLRCVYPRLVDVADAKSTIEYMGASWKSNITKWIDNKKVFPFYQLLRYKRNLSRMKMMKVEFV